MPFLLGTPLYLARMKSKMNFGDIEVFGENNPEKKSFFQIIPVRLVFVLESWG